MIRILFLGSKPIGFKCLEYILDQRSRLNIKVVGVLSNDNLRFDKSMSVKQLALDNNIPFYEDLEDILNIPKVDFIFSVQYHLILKEDHIAHAKRLAVNLHMAPLPEYRGCNQFSFAIYNGATEFGTTLHRLEPGVDDGAIIAERRFPIEENELVKSLYDKCYNESIILFKDNFQRIIENKFDLIPQSELEVFRGSRTYYRKDINKLKEIDLHASADEITSKARATAMPGFEPPYAVHNGRKYYIVPEEMLNTKIHVK